MIVGRIDSSPKFQLETGPTKIGTWTHVAVTHAGVVVFYDRAGAQYASFTVTDGGTLSPMWDGNAPQSADALVAAGQTFLLFYRNDGSGVLGDFAGGALQGTAWTYPVAKLNLAATPLLLAGSGNGTILFYDTTNTVESIVRGFRPMGNPSELRNYLPDSGAFDVGWTEVLDVGSLA